MKNNLISDIKTAVGVFRDIRQGRKNDNVPVARKSVDIINMGAPFHGTIEGCLLSNHDEDIHDIALKAFKGLTHEEQCRFSYSPKDGEFIERANFWRTLLKPLMTPVQYGIAITEILHHYIQIKQRMIQEQGREVGT